MFALVIDSAEIAFDRRRMKLSICGSNFSASQALLVGDLLDATGEKKDEHVGDEQCNIQETSCNTTTIRELP